MLTSKAKDALLSFVVERIFADIPTYHDTDLPWRERIRRVMHAYYDIYVTHPQVLELCASHYSREALYMRHEQDMRTLVEAGFSPRSAYEAIGLLTTFTHGMGLIHKDSLSRPPGWQDRLMAALEDKTPLIRTAVTTQAKDARATFDACLNAILDGLEQRWLKERRD